ncbi:MAG: DUF5686 and carboxypeptidase regulatory-like domain-containing protein [Flavobacteriaceae bacterium]|nr:DUF5686 and carboxypeptidase regulatory-like domain-containing protein [Flavobacteriaceae bacterium]
MLTKLTLFFLFITSAISFAQVSGIITDKNGEPLPYVNIYLQGSYVGTTSNDFGTYEIDLPKKESYQLVFQFLGYKTLTKKVAKNELPLTLNVILEEESISLETVVLSSSEDPAYRIIRKTIAQRKENLNRITAFTADFYSRGLWRVKDMPEKIMGQEVGDMEGALDSTRTGVIYLSETISEIAYQHPNDFREIVKASLVSGNDNGFSFNSARQSNFSFYENTIDLNAPIVSPISVNALNYYKYKLDGVFYEGSKLINKIIVTPKRPKDRIWEGVIYIVEDDWQLYGVNLSTTGAAIQVPMITKLDFKQNFKYDEKKNAWIKISQTIDFGFAFFGVKGDGRFIANYSNYDFKPTFEKNDFSNEVLSFMPKANKKDSVYWKEYRPVPLSIEELKDYVKKDSIQTLRKSKSYLDSIDNKSNKFGFMDPLLGYSFQNSYKKYKFSYEGPLTNINYNTVQGWNSKVGLSYNKWYDDNRTVWLTTKLNATYGIIEDRLRFNGIIAKRFNYKNKLTFQIDGGSKVKQFNNDEPISPMINAISTLFFERNYMKLYELNYGRLAYSQEIVNGFKLTAATAYENRKPLYNAADWVFIPNSGVSYTSNNPLNPSDFENAAIIDHDVFKTFIKADIVFGQKYISFPDGKFNLTDSKFPQVTFRFENGIGISESKYSFSQLSAKVYQNLSLGNKGTLTYNLKAGTFINGENISFVDFQHFNGNQTRVGTASIYDNVFNLLPYYELSTNKNYFEGHLEHDFKGWVLGKIPGINQLNFNLIAGAHFLSTGNNKPYSELSIGIDNLGFGKYRVLRLDYVRSFYNGSDYGAIIFGLKFLDLLGVN